MKKLYWRPQRLSSRILLLIAVVAATSVIAVETFKVRERQRHYREKIQAARRALAAYKAVKEERRQLGIPIDPETDPARTGIIGELISPVTTNTGHLAAKQTSVNPNFAAVIVEWLEQIRVKPGDVVAIGLSGSFPALNIATMAAVETLRLRALTISSAGASQWGANIPQLTWPDMERVLVQKGILHHRSIAASLGGIEDRGLGLSKAGRRLLMESIERNGLPLIDSPSYEESLKRRMDIYRDRAGDADIRAYINVGGGTTSVGTHIGRDLFSPGLNLNPPRGGPQIDSVMSRFAQRGIPVIHLSKINRLAERYGLATTPHTIPPVGEGSVFWRLSYSVYLAGLGLLVVVGMLVAFLRLDLAHRLLSSGARSNEPGRPEPMV